MSFWTDERIDQLTKLWRAGHSARDIAFQLGASSRDAVIGKVHRLKLHVQFPRAKSAKPKPSPAPRKPGRVGSILMRAQPILSAPRAPAVRLPAATRLPAVVKESLMTRPAGRCSLMELTAERCKWPIGDVGTPGFAFCGAAKSAEAGPYCAQHEARARGRGV
jgi:GcrA cell cycle regulator